MDVKNKTSHYPITDAQGNIRGYATKQGLQSAYDYYPYGTVVELAPYIADDNKRWQSKEYDGEHGKYYFGARYFDPFFAQWMSPDPANQFANPYTYGGDPINYVDPNGEIAISTGVVIAGAIIGAVIGGSTAAYQCSKYGSGNCSTGISAGATVGAAAGAASGAAGGAVSAAAGASEGAIAGGIAGGAAGNATGYVANGLITGQSMSFSEGFRTSMTAAFAGGIGGVVGYGVGQNAFGAIAGGSVGNMSGAFLNGARGVDLLYAGGNGAVAGFAGYAANWMYENHYRPGDLENTTQTFEETIDLAKKESGMIAADEYEILAAEDFKEFHKSANWEHSEGESIAGYRKRTAFWTGEKYVSRMRPNHFEGTSSKIDNVRNMDMVFHSHPNNPFPSPQDYFSSSQLYKNNRINSYLLAPNNNDVYKISPSNRQFFRLGY